MDFFFFFFLKDPDHTLDTKKKSKFPVLFVIIIGFVVKITPKAIKKKQYLGEITTLGILGCLAWPEGIHYMSAF